MARSRGTLGTRRTLSHRFGGKAYPSALDDGNTVKWFNYLENVTKDGSNLVSAWDNKTGINGIIPGALLQAGADSIKPIWSADGILFDGVDDFMKTANFTLNQPEFIYIVFKQISWVSGDRIFDGQNSNSGGLKQTTLTPNINANAGANSSESSNLALNTYGVVRLLFNGTSSKLIINDETPITGDFGSENMSGFTLGARGTSVAWSHIEVREIIIRKIADNATGESAIYNYIKKQLVDDTTRLQALIDAKTEIPSGVYTISKSIKITSSGTYSFAENVTINLSDTFADPDHSVIVSKDRHAAFRVTANDVNIDFNDAIINCNQDTLLADSKYMSCVFFYNCSTGKAENLEGNNTHDVVYGNTVAGLIANNIEISGLSSITDDNYKNSALDIQFCSNVSGSGFSGYGCEEVVDINDGNDGVTLSSIYGEETLQSVLEINDSKDVTVDGITGLNLTGNELVRIQNYDSIPWPNQDFNLTNIQDNSNIVEAGTVADVKLYLTP